MESRLVLARYMETYQERITHAQLQPYATVSWSYRIDSDGQCPAFVPSGCPDVLWIGGRPWLGGTYGAAVIEQGARDSVVIGIGLRPGVVTAWTGIAAADLLGVRLPLASVLPDLAARVVDAVGDASDPAVISARIQEVVAGDLARLETPSNLDALIRRTLQAPGVARQTARQIADSLGLSERTLRRYCTTLFGYGPKMLERVLRAGRFLDMASQSPQRSIAWLSDAAGYSDQAHLTREARLLTGLTPKAIIAQYSANRTTVAEIFKTAS